MAVSFAMNIHRSRRRKLSGFYDGRKSSPRTDRGLERAKGSHWAGTREKTCSLASEETKSSNFFRYDLYRLFN